MKKNKLFLIFPPAMLLLGSQNVVLANDLSSTGSASFIENDAIVPPVNPLDPDKPVKPINPGTRGPLSINDATNYQFGTQKMDSKEATYSALLPEIEDSTTGKKSKVPHFVQITDNRGGEKGWRLEVKQDKPFTNESGFTLKGTSISFSSITAISLVGGGTSPQVPNKPVVISGDSEQNVTLITAKPDSGGGSWGILFGELGKGAESGVKLTIPGNIEKKEGLYSTTLTWTLVDSI